MNELKKRVRLEKYVYADITICVEVVNKNISKKSKCAAVIDWKYACYTNVVRAMDTVLLIA
jgi:hypothetical protein